MRMTTTRENFEGGMYYDRASANDAVERLRALGYSNDDISVMMKDRERANAFAHETGTKAAEGTVTGGVIGGGIGAIIGALTATGSIAATVGTGGLALPLVAGPLAAAVAGLGAGGLVGGVVGALIGAGIPEDRAKEYAHGLDRGGMLLGVHPRPGERERVRQALTPVQSEYGTIDASRTQAYEHTRNLKQTLGEVQRHLREDITGVTDPAARAMFETSAEVLGALIKTYDDYESRKETAFR